MNKNILIIGTYFGDTVDSYRWWSQLPNLADYATVILDPTRLMHDWLYEGRVKPLSLNRYLLSGKNEQDEKIQSNMRLVKRKIIEMLQFDVDIYVLYSPTVTIEYVVSFKADGNTSRESVKFMETNDWCPINIDTFSETGKIIHIEDDSYQQYFKDFTKWDYYFVSESLNPSDVGRHYDKKWKTIVEKYDVAVNNVDKPLAIELKTYFHNWRHDRQGKLDGFDSVPHVYGGRIILLPIMNSYDTKPHIEFLLNRAGLFKQTPPPSWVSAIEIPGETSIKIDIETRRQQLEAMKSTIEELETSLADLQKYKGLLYETGLTLQGLVKLTLKNLGAEIESSPVTDEFIVNISGKKALIEVKGNTKSITKADLGQLITDLGEYLKATDEDIGGILIGNAWRLESIEARDKHDKPIFSQAVVKIAENRNIGLISSTELFEAYRKVLVEPTQKEVILNKIIGGGGIIKL